MGNKITNLFSRIFSWKTTTTKECVNIPDVPVAQQQQQHVIRHEKPEFSIIVTPASDEVHSVQQLPQEEREDIVHGIFSEYQKRCISEPGFMRHYTDLWGKAELCIHALSMTEQAKYACYVIDKVCQLGDEYVIDAANHMLDPLYTSSFSNCFADVVAIGNSARICLALRDIRENRNRSTKIRRLLRSCETSHKKLLNKRIMYLD